jgi:hypothetical protein
MQHAEQVLVILETKGKQENLEIEEGPDKLYKKN